MKYFRIFSAILIWVLLLSCKKTVYQDMNPQLKVVVKNSDQNPVKDASVYLYASVDDFQNNTNVVNSGTSDETGSVLFTDLQEVIYYFMAEYDGKCNCYGVSATSDSLQKGYVVIVETIIK